MLGVMLISFAPITLMQKIAKQTPLKSKFMVQKPIQNRGLLCVSEMLDRHGQHS